MNRLLAMCPSKGRPQALKDMLDSFQATTSQDVDLAIYLGEDDAKLEEYRAVLENYKAPCISVTIGKSLFLAQAVNLLWNSNREYIYYQVINDDHYYVTPHWNEILTRVIVEQGGGWGIACPEDGLTNWHLWKHPSAEIISGNIPKTLGYYVYPRIRHIGIDACIGRLGMGIGRLFKVGEVMIEHRHWSNGKRLLDANYKFVYGSEEQDYGNTIMREYLGNPLQEDIRKLKQAMQGGGNG